MPSADTDAVGGVLMRIKFLAEKPLDQRGLACCAVSNKDELDLVDRLIVSFLFGEILTYCLNALLGNLTRRGDERIAIKPKLF
jgi:hypothetical protein